MCSFLTCVLFVVTLSVNGFVLKPTTHNVARSLSTQLDYKVRLINKKKNTDVSFDCDVSKYILDEAEQQVLAAIPWSCRAGSCSSCIGSIVSGSVDQSNQIFLDDDKIDMGYVLTCVAYPTSDVTIEVDIEAEYYSGISGRLL